ncbi:MAG: Asp-tRNA(Asn)/Glu-tRNA(Gln) amidotransferase subunit GatA [Gemmatimonadetes bacterium]|nr:Asp-tRNA(Asn)/Glu-tRNA(Gln) amidotransferase subunit GatA [Gemmatimonadota bacterium]
MNPPSHQPAVARTVADAWARFDVVHAGPGGLNAFLAQDRSARALGTGEGPPRPLDGVPVAIKDNLATLGLPTTCGSRLLEGYVSPYEATAVRRLREAGAVIVGKTNLDEFGMGSTTEFSAFGPTRNPLDRERVPGGSSGGSAAAVAAGVVPVALGSETGGSVRQPAAWCGVVGLKPTYGRVSRYGLVAYASSLDHVGVFGATVADAARGLQAIAGEDPADATSLTTPVADYPAAVASAWATSGGSDQAPLAGVVVGRPREYFPEGLDPRLADCCERALARLRDLGATVRDVTLPHTALAIPAYYIIAPAEASSNLARYDGVRYGRRAPAEALRPMYERTRAQFGPEVTRRILLGTYVLSAGYYDAYYRQAQRARAAIASDFARLFAQGVQLLFTPTAPTTAPRLGALTDPYSMYLGDCFTVPANLAGIPAVSLPVGRVEGLPVGGQLMAAHGEEARLLRIAACLERALGAEAHQ